MTLALGLLAAGCSDKGEKAAAPPRLVSAFQVGMTEQLGQRQFQGLAKAEREAVLSFRVPGQIFTLPARVGQNIEAGAVVATLDASPYQAEVTRLSADLDNARADLKLKTDQYDRVMPLVKSGTYPKSRGDDALSAKQGSEARVASVQSALDRARIDLDLTVLKSPFAGRVVAVYPETFEEVRTQQQIVRVVDINSLEAVIDIPETLISLVPRIETMEARFDAFPDVPVQGKIVEIGSEASAVTRTFPVTVGMQQPKDALVLPGMAGNFRVTAINTAGATAAMVVPPASIRPLEPGKDAMAVWVVDPASGKVALRPVMVGRIVQGGIEIKDGLKPGDWVVSAGANSLADGEIVRLPKAPEAAKAPAGDAS
ncbi:RND family efflux transporter MFP subunit [Kaistia hirudinis]|uniref:RND family efflux transporter MFP subunit n=1 Tax=Kaistia hirudinis TaxID=1293440 RepID=A0A840AS95_9HYPH|nr:efflux RND transporter periplasmic adaptor subunit [Kaistia hirudinis]MBB3933260.1 RND family efflux transporter MFP subunit [Kaistia hirudinis]